MPLTHSILHQIARASETATVETVLRDQENPAEDRIVSLYEQLRQTFVRSNARQVGQFDAARGDNPFPALLRDLQTQTLDLTRLSQRLMPRLTLALDGLHAPFHGHLLFALDTAMQQQQLLILWFEHQQAEYITAQLDVAMLDYIDTRQLVAALSVNLSNYHEAPEEKYLTLYCGRGYREIGECFEQFACFTTEVNTAKETEAFLEIVEQYTRSLPEEQAQLRKNDIIDYCIEQNLAGEPVHVESLSLMIDEHQPEAFSRFVTEHQATPKKTIHTHRPVLKRYGRYSGRDKDISLSFNAALVGEGIEFDAAQDAIIIRHIPKGLKEQLVKAMKEKE